MPPLGVGTVDSLLYGPAEALWCGMHREAPGQMLGVCGSMEKAFVVGSSEYSRHVAATQVSYAQNTVLYDLHDYLTTCPTKYCTNFCPLRIMYLTICTILSN